MWNPEEFGGYIDSLRLRHLRADEFLIRADQPENDFPPQAFWGNLALTARLLDLIRDHYNRPVVVTPPAALTSCQYWLR